MENKRKTDPELTNVKDYIYINIGGSINFVEDHEVYQLFGAKYQAETFDNADARSLHDTDSDISSNIPEKAPPSQIRVIFKHD